MSIPKAMEARVVKVVEELTVANRRGIKEVQETQEAQVVQMAGVVARDSWISSLGQLRLRQCVVLNQVRVSTVSIRMPSRIPTRSTTTIEGERLQVTSVVQSRDGGTLTFHACR
jgi:hypothetical protein